MHVTSADRATAASLVHGPHWTFDETTFSFGYSQPDVAIMLSHDFYFLNTGDQPLDIISLGTACKTVSWCNKRSIAPGERGFIRLTVSPPREYALDKGFARQVEIVSNDPNQPRVELKVIIDFQYTLCWDPLDIRFGTMSDYTSCTKTCVVDSRTTESFHLTAIRSEEGLYDVRITSWTLEGKKTKPPAMLEASSPPLRKIILSIRPRSTTITSGKLVDTIRILTDRKDIPVIAIPASCQIYQPLSSQPGEVFLGFIRGRKAVEKEVILRAPVGAKVICNHSDIPGLFTTIEGANGTWHVRVRYVPDGSDGPISGFLHAELVDSTTGSLTIPVRGLIKLKKQGLSTR